MPDQKKSRPFGRFGLPYMVPELKALFFIFLAVTALQ
jgi:hypothetical protein